MSICRAEADNPNTVKVVRDAKSHALYFSRSLIPFHRAHPQKLNHVYRHIGLYAYRAQFLMDLVHTPSCELEDIEALEQLRVLYLGHKIKVEQAKVPPNQDINTPEDYQRALSMTED